MGLAQNEMKAKPALPERVRSMEGLGLCVEGAAICGLWVVCERSRIVGLELRKDRVKISNEVLLTANWLIEAERINTPATRTWRA